MKQYTPAEILKWIPAVDHPALNGLRNGLGSKVSIPVTLYQGDAVVLKADVMMYGHTYNLFGPALAMLLGEMKERGVTAEWDSVVFTAPNKKFPRADFEADMTGASLAAYMHRFRKTDLTEAIITCGREMAEGQKPGQTPEAEKAFLDDNILKLCAAVLASSVEVKSDDLKRLTPKRGFFERLKGFKP